MNNITNPLLGISQHAINSDTPKDITATHNLILYCFRVLNELPRFCYLTIVSLQCSLNISIYRVISVARNTVVLMHLICLSYVSENEMPTISANKPIYSSVLLPFPS